MPIYKTAQFQIHPVGLEKAKQAIRDFVAYVKQHEPQTQLYTSMQEAEDETRFLHFFIFEDAAAEEQHRTSDGVNRFVEILHPETVDGVVFKDYTELASTHNG